MKICPKCQTQVNDDVVFCPNCGNNFAEEANAQATNTQAPVNTPVAAPVYTQPVEAVSDFDHTAEFDAKDISDNKVVAMCVYLLGAFGILIALLASKESPYAGFHVRQGLKFTVIITLTAILSGLLCWTCIAPFAGCIFMVVLFVCKIISFFQVCKGMAIEPYVIRAFTFLK